MSDDTVTDGFDFPCGPPDGHGYHLAAGLVEASYREQFGTWHSGEDWHGLAGGDSGLGDPICVIANGFVVASDYYRPGWGNIVLVEHRMPAGDLLWSQYSHLEERRVGVGERVVRGQEVGTMGKGDSDYPAHLHFEIRRHRLAPDRTGLSRDQVLAWYVRPSEFIRAHRPVPAS